MGKACCGFGHRFVLENIAPALKKEVERAVEEGCRVFYTGAQGDFDNFARRESNPNSLSLALFG